MLIVDLSSLIAAYLAEVSFLCMQTVTEAQNERKDNQGLLGTIRALMALFGLLWI